MPFDLDATLKAMAKAAMGVFKSETGKVRAAVKEVLEDRRQALKDIADARLRGELDDREVEIQLRDEKLAFETGMAMVKALSKASIQKASNAAFGVLMKAIGMAL